MYLVTLLGSERHASVDYRTQRVREELPAAHSQWTLAGL